MVVHAELEEDELEAAQEYVASKPVPCTEPSDVNRKTIARLDPE
eukprot:COSAG06_NODE_234_length_19567_cov_23.768595_13_plen_44_part_00